MPLSEKDGYKLTMRFQQNINRLVHAFIMTSLMGAVGKSCLFLPALPSHSPAPGWPVSLGADPKSMLDRGRSALPAQGPAVPRPHGVFLGRVPRRPRSLFGSRSPRKLIFSPFFPPQNAAPRCGSLCRVCTGRAEPLCSRGWGRERREPLLSHKP